MMWKLTCHNNYFFLFVIYIFRPFFNLDPLHDRLCFASLLLPERHILDVG